MGGDKGINEKILLIIFFITYRIAPVLDELRNRHFGDFTLNILKTVPLNKNKINQVQPRSIF